MSDNIYHVWDLINAEILKANTNQIEHTICGNMVTNITMLNKVIEPFNANVCSILRSYNIEYNIFSYDMKNTRLMDKHFIFFTVPHYGNMSDNNYSYVARIYMDTSRPFYDDGAAKLGFKRTNAKE
jgi:hypothetical protein